MTAELLKSLIWYLFKLRKVGWLDYGRRGLHEGEENSVKYLKKGMEQKGRKKKQTLKRRAKLCQGVGALKRRTCIVQTLLLHKEGMRLFKYGCNGRGMGNFYEKLGGGGGRARNRGQGFGFIMGDMGTF